MDSDLPSAKSSNRQKHNRSKHKKDHHANKKNKVPGKPDDRKTRNELKEPRISVPQNAETTEDDDEESEDSQGLSFDYKNDKTFSRKPLSQPKARFAEIKDEVIDENESQSFESLLSVPVTAGHFTFKSEKNWTVDTSKYADYFSVDVERLSKIINCIPFNQYVSVEDKYFTKDQLTIFQSDADHHRKDIEAELIQREIKDEKSTIPDVDDDLDFLLSLTEPVLPMPMNISSKSTKFTKEPKAKNTPTPIKSINLESWLDSVLDD